MDARLWDSGIHPRGLHRGLPLIFASRHPFCSSKECSLNPTSRSVNLPSPVLPCYFVLYTSSFPDRKPLEGKESCVIFAHRNIGEPYWGLWEDTEWGGVRPILYASLSRVSDSNGSWGPRGKITPCRHRASFCWGSNQCPSVWQWDTALPLWAPSPLPSLTPWPFRHPSSPLGANCFLVFSLASALGFDPG